ncbi:Vicilin-like seed storage protein [Citrus sinensis]|uniref:Vicilin-like seed storage protein n=1 Tax=Citrus sinensis TaxID=2711 RepID=A0ACB8I6Y5_CITSI|nr:Vicilin-like seed storage protein [Citrus sinensis]
MISTPKRSNQLLCYEIPAGQKTAVDRCIDRCRETEEELSGLFSCSARCERRYSEWEPESSPRELEQCQQRCLADERADREQQQQCQKRCKEQQAIREREEERHREQRERDWEREREQFEDINIVPQDPEEEYKQYEGNNHHRDPKWQHEQCLKQCERRESGEQQQQQCKSWCEKHRQKGQRRREKEGKFNPSSNWQGSEEEEENNPYYFHSQRFRYRVRSDSGHMRVLQRFSQKSHLLRGIDNYRLAILEANPSTLVVPHHSDAETILVLLKGKGVITLVSHERRESFNMEHGDVISVPAGTTYYLSNQDNVDRLHVAKLLQPVNTPGQFREYYAAGGGFPESYYKVFSYDILERALNTYGLGFHKTPREQLHSLFEVQQRQQGTIKRASQEQLKALSHHASSRRRHGRGSTAPFNLLSRKPIYNNNFGRFFEATPKDYQQLQEIDAGVTYVEINQGGMMVPHYNSKATTIVLVVEGRGRFEMGGPLSSRWSQESQREQQEEEEEEESSRELQKISANLSPGVVFIIPPGHPIALVASPNEKLLTVGFSLNARNNQRNFLAGKINIMNQVERETMEVAFNVPARLIERVFGINPKESYFVAGPEEQQQRDEAGSGKSLPSILDIAGVF